MNLPPLVFHDKHSGQALNNCESTLIMAPFTHFSKQQDNVLPVPCQSPLGNFHDPLPSFLPVVKHTNAANMEWLQIVLKPITLVLVGL